MSDFLYLLENEVQIAALSFLVLVYFVRLIWLFHFRPMKERTFPAGNPHRGAAMSLMNVAMPWAMESTRKRPGFYAQFALFHLGVTVAIGATFIIPYRPGWFDHTVIVRLFQVILAAAFVVGTWRLFRRIFDPRIRLISSLDDYFSLTLMILYFAVAFFAVPNDYHRREWPLMLFFGLTAFFLVYVPFSKISHYLYYPFTRYFLGRTMGHRGVFGRRTRM